MSGLEFQRRPRAFLPSRRSYRAAQESNRALDEPLRIDEDRSTIEASNAAAPPGNEDLLIAANDVGERWLATKRTRRGHFQVRLYERIAGGSFEVLAATSVYEVALSKHDHHAARLTKGTGQ